MFYLNQILDWNPILLPTLNLPCYYELVFTDVQFLLKVCQPTVLQGFCELKAVGNWLRNKTVTIRICHFKKTVNWIKSTSLLQTQFYPIVYSLLASRLSTILYSIYTANISAVKITVFRRVRFPTVFPLYFLHSITAPSTVKKCKHRFTVVYYKINTFTW